MKQSGFGDVESLRVLARITSLIRSEEQLEYKFQKALDLTRQVIEYHAASLFLVNDKTGQIEEAATHGTKVELIESTQFEMGSGLSAWVAKHRDSVLLPDVRKKREDGFRSFVSSPLVSGDKLVGVLSLGHRESDFFHEDHLKLLGIIAGELALLIDRSRFERELVETNQELLRAQNELEKQQIKLVEMEKYRLLAQVTTSINHEINNPLTSILGNIELILLKYPSLDENLAQKLRIIQEEAARISDIIKKLGETKRIVLKDYLPESETKMLDIDGSI
ncbi:GAF domain-containing protein [Candidatus Latescibacterota bacterium]